MDKLRHALLLTAGLGTRLRPLTLVRAKPAVPIGGEPIVRRILRRLALAGVEDVVLNLHHLPETIAAVVGDGGELGVRARYSWEQPEVLGSAGGPRQALPIVGAGTFFVLNGDTLTDFDLQHLARAHDASTTLVTLALVPNHEPLRYGGVLLDGDGDVTGFVRRGPGAVGSFHFVGVQVTSAQTFAWLPAGQPFNSIGYAYDRLIKEYPGSIKGVVVETGFWDIGSVTDYIETSRHFDHDGRNAETGTGSVRVGSGATVSRSILWDRVQIGDRAVIDECIVTDDVSVPAGSLYRRAILLSGPGGLTSQPIDQI